MTYSGRPTENVAPDVFAGRELPFTPDDFRQIADMMNHDAGIAFAEAKAPGLFTPGETLAQSGY